MQASQMQVALPTPAVVNAGVYEDWRSGTRTLNTTGPLITTSSAYMVPQMVVQQGPPQRKSMNDAAMNQPARQYVTDGYTINDEVGTPIAQVISLSKNKGTDIVSMQGEPWLRYDKQTKEIRDLRTNKVFAMISHKDKIVRWGYSPHWEPKNEVSTSAPPKLYRYITQEDDGATLNIFVYDAKTNRHVATVTRLSSGAYPSRIAIQSNVPYHLLLCILFLI